MVGATSYLALRKFTPGYYKSAHSYEIKQGKKRLGNIVKMYPFLKAILDERDVEAKNELLNDSFKHPYIHAAKRAFEAEYDLRAKKILLNLVCYEKYVEDDESFETDHQEMIGIQTDYFNRIKSFIHTNNMLVTVIEARKLLNSVGEHLNNIKRFQDLDACKEQSVSSFINLIKTFYPGSSTPFLNTLEYTTDIVSQLNQARELTKKLLWGNGEIDSVFHDDFEFINNQCSELRSKLNNVLHNINNEAFVDLIDQEREHLSKENLENVQIAGHSAQSKARILEAQSKMKRAKHEGVKTWIELQKYYDQKNETSSRNNHDFDDEDYDDDED